jgi:TonB family protein
MAGLVPSLPAQKASKSDRQVLVSPKPEYPDLLKRAQIGGLVRLKATVLINGTVGNVAVVGGNPVLAESAMTAIKRWKYAPSASQTVEDITVNFNPRTD